MFSRIIVSRPLGILFATIVSIVGGCANDASVETGTVRGATTTCGTVGNPLALMPILECVATDSAGVKSAIWGYAASPGASTPIVVPLGGLNTFSPGAAGQGQPTVFGASGKHVAVTRIPASGAISWTLGGVTKTATPSSPACSPAVDDVVTIAGDPVPLLIKDDAELLGTYAPTNIIAPVPQGHEAATSGVAPAGQFEVSNDGAATYSLPLWVPDGRAGIQPHLALSYSSKRGNSIAGVGWTLTGLSSISRCAKSIAIDNESLPVTFGTNDRYCLDGDYLIKVDSGDPEAVEFQPEHDPGTRVRAFGEVDGPAGPHRWEVHLIDGRTRHYGGTPDSTLRGRRSSFAYDERDTIPPVESLVDGHGISWALESEVDRSGNMLAITYFNSTECSGSSVSPPLWCGPEAFSDTAQLRPRNIRYTYGAGRDWTREVNFFYEQRPDVERTTTSGVRSMQAFVLKRIDVLGPNPRYRERLRSYHLEYNWEGRIPGPLYVTDTSGVTSSTGRSLLVGFRECAFDPDPTVGTDVCSERLRFDWNHYENSQSYELFDRIAFSGRTWAPVPA